MASNAYSANFDDPPARTLATYASMYLRLLQLLPPFFGGPRCRSAPLLLIRLPVLYHSDPLARSCPHRGSRKTISLTPILATRTCHCFHRSRAPGQAHCRALQQLGACSLPARPRLLKPLTYSEVSLSWPPACISPTPPASAPCRALYGYGTCSHACAQQRSALLPPPLLLARSRTLASCSLSSCRA